MGMARQQHDNTDTAMTTRKRVRYQPKRRIDCSQLRRRIIESVPEEKRIIRSVPEEEDNG